VAAPACAGRVYVTNQSSNDLSVLDAATNTPVAGSPFATGGTTPIEVATCPPQASVVPPAADLVVRFTG
jgi:YVTN family beta-propeller protein